MSIPTLTTERLILRPFSLSDASVVQKLAGDHAIADTTLNIPYPYLDGMAEMWIKSLEKGFVEGRGAHFAVTLRQSADLIGACGLSVNAGHQRGELGYWITKTQWKKGFCTEAAAAVLRFSFDVFKLHRVHSYHLARNPASGRVMEKIGMTREGLQRQHIKKWDRFEDIVDYGILAEDFFARAPSAATTTVTLGV